MISVKHILYMVCNNKIMLHFSDKNLETNAALIEFFDTVYMYVVFVATSGNKNKQPCEVWKYLQFLVFIVITMPPYYFLTACVLVVKSHV